MQAGAEVITVNLGGARGLNSKAAPSPDCQVATACCLGSH